MRSSRRTPRPSAGSSGSGAEGAASRRAGAGALVGIHTRGAVLGERLHALVGELTGSEVPFGDLDISFYRDDVNAREPGAQPVVHASHLDFELEGRTVVLVDDVLFTGRTVRAAIDALFDYGRPQRVQLAVLVDRGHRELPIRPDYVGKNLPTARDERVYVRVEELDGVDEVAIAGDASEAPAMRHLLAIADLERPTSSGSWSAPRDSPRWAAATSRRCRRFAAGRSSTSSTSRAPARAPRSSSPPSASPPTSSRSSRRAPRSTRASRSRTRSPPSAPTARRRS